VNAIAGGLSAAAAAAAVAAVGVFDPRSPLFGKAIARGPRDARAVYLTFDDGPSPSATPRILETLDQAGVPAAFFMVGEHVRRFPALARAARDRGHEIGNHTQRHRKLYYRAPRFIDQELRQAHESIVDTVGVTPRCFRAPHGLRSPFVHAAARRMGYDVIAWSFGVWDTERPGAPEIRRRVRDRLRPGAIVLLHDGDGRDPDGDRSQTAEALPGIIADARNAGYDLRPLAELLTSR
jgi:peptidoglycan/xylan/chitin deacetylase (PgdA/CDA1 family)